MKLKNQIFAILAIFCVILSACAVSAADNGNLNVTDGDMYDPGVPYHADGTDPTHTPVNNTTDNATDGDMYDPGVPYHADGTDPKDAADYVVNGDNYDPGVPYHADGTDPKDAADYVINGDNYDPGVPYHADGSDPTQTPIGNETVNATGNTTHAAGEPAATTHTMPATGNPILVLFAIGAVLVGAGLISKRK